MRATGLLYMRLCLNLLLAGLAICALSGAGGTHAQEHRYALLIGNQAYDASVGVLKNPHNDIELVSKSLAAQGFEILPLVKDARRGAILGAVRELANKLRSASGNAVGFLYYSGHGAAEKDTNINYLIPVDARDPGTTAFWDDSLKLDDVLKLLDTARNAVKFVVFDACRNELQIPTRDTSKGLLPVADQQGLFVAFASAPGRTASDRGERSGPYAAALAQELGRQGLDHLNLFQNVKETVLASTGGAQHPWESNGLTRRVYLTGEPTTPADVALWEQVSKSNDVPSLERYLQQFPKGLFANAAQQIISRLNSEREERARAEAERKAAEAAQTAALQQALAEAKSAREAVATAQAQRALAEQQRVAALAREEQMRKAQDLAIQQGRTGDAAAAQALAEQARAAAEDARKAREALDEAETRRKESESRVAALEQAERERQQAIELLRQKDEAAAKRADVNMETLRKAQEELLQRREIKFSQWTSINDDCTQAPLPTVEIVKKPKYGTIVLRDARLPLQAVAEKKRERCLGTMFNHRLGYYILDEKHRDRTDTDIVAMRLRYGNGTVDNVEYEIDIKDRASTRTKFERKR